MQTRTRKAHWPLWLAALVGCAGLILWLLPSWLGDPRPVGGADEI